MTRYDDLAIELNSMMFDGAADARYCRGRIAQSTIPRAGQQYSGVMLFLLPPRRQSADSGAPQSAFHYKLFAGLIDAPDGISGHNGAEQIAILA